MQRIHIGLLLVALLVLLNWYAYRRPAASELPPQPAAGDRIVPVFDPVVEWHAGSDALAAIALRLDSTETDSRFLLPEQVPEATTIDVQIAFETAAGQPLTTVTRAVVPDC